MSNKEFNRLPDILPKDIAANSAEFVTFLKKYYEFMNQDGLPSYILNNAVLERDVSNSVGNYLSNLYRELGYGYSLNTEANRQNIIQHLPEIYSAKGSVDSIKVLFRVLFGEEVNITFPKELILIPSSGNWLSQYSVMMELVEGDPFSIIGKFVQVETNFPNTPTQTFEVEVKRVERKTDTIYEVFTSRYFSGFFYWGSKITYLDLEMNLIPSMSAILNIEDGGSGFRVGDTFVVNDYARQSTFNDTIGIPSTYTRNVPSQSKFRNYDVQSVDIDVRTDGTITEVINYESDEFGSIERTNVIRGTNQVVRLKYQDGTEEEFTETIDGIVAPNLQVNWDEIASAMVELSEFEAPEFPLPFFSFLQSENPVTLAAYADLNEDGRISAADAIIMLKCIVGHYSSGDPEYDNYQAIKDDWQTLTGETITLGIFTVINVLRISVGLYDPNAAALEILIDWIQEANLGSDYVRGDIDNDGVIDTDDMIAILKYIDETGLRTELSTAEINWIEQEILNPFNALTGSGELFDGLTEDDVILAMGLTYSAGKRNILHDFLLQVDGDYNTGHVRADINNDGSITTEDVQILLRRSAGISIADEYLTWIDEVIVEPLIGSEYNPVLIDGAGSGAICRVEEVDGSTAITKLAFQSFGYNYPDNFTTFVEPASEGGTVASITFGNKIVGVTDPNYVDRKGFLSDIIKIQDNDFYQQFSYVIETGVDFDAFSDILSKSINPAGMKFFANQTITDDFSIEVEQTDDTSFYYNRIAYDIAYYSEVTTNHFYKDRQDETTASDDGSTYAIEKVRADEATALSNKETYHLDKTRSDEAEASEQDVYHIHKPRSDEAEASEQDVYHMDKVRSDEAEASEQETYSLIKPREDFYQASTEESKEFGKAREDSVENYSDYDYYHMDKSRLDEAEASELETFDIGKVREDEAEATEQEAYSIKKPREDFYEASEEESKEFGKAREDYLENYSDREYIDFGKGVEEFLSGVVDSKQSFDISKLLYDTAIPSDITTLADKDIFSLKKYISEPGIPVSDARRIAASFPLNGEDGEIIELVTDFAKVYLTKGFSESIDYSDSFSRLVDYNRSFADESTISDVAIREANYFRTLNDSFVVSDEYDLLTVNANSESIGASEALIREASYFRTLNDSFVVSENADLLTANTNSDSIGASEALIREASYFRTLNDSFVVSDEYDLLTVNTNSESIGASENVIRIAEYNRSLADTSTASEGTVYTINKTLSDAATVSDDTTLQDDDIYHINKVITNSTASSDSTDLLMTKPYVEEGYFGGNYYSDYAADIVTRSV